MATELAAGLWWYDLRGVNAYLIDDDGVLTLVDAGTPFSRRRLILGLDRAGYSPSNIDRVLVTHYDFDHVGGLGRLQRLDATIYAGTPDARLITGKGKPDWRTHKGFSQRLTAPFLSSPSDPVETVEDGDTVGSFTVYHTPGHTPGHVCYVSEDHSVAFLGDLVREDDGRLEPSPWIMSDDTDQVRASIRRLADEVPDFEVAAMGHGVPFREGGRDRLHELADRL
ncbi:MAG: MBL fold metallo-hydrolase [Halapricum sp.]